jgi:phage terminase small subunit
MPAHRKPDNVHKLNGTYRKDRHGKPEEKVDFDEPDGYPAPDWLADNAKQEWFRITNLYKGTGVITEPDLMVLAGYCTLVGQMQDNPAGMKMSAHAQVTRYSNILGFGALNRQNIRSPLGKPAAKDTGRHGRENPFERTKKKKTP